jgi:hypothetical protein
MPAFLDDLRSRAATYVITLLFALLAIFSDKLVERVKFALNRADMREAKYATFASELSVYIFDCELLEEDLEHGWTTAANLTPLITEYNGSITELRKNQFSDRAMLIKYWDKKRSQQFDEIMQSILQLDAAVHNLNDEYELVNLRKSKEKVDPQKAAANATSLKDLLKVFKPKVDTFLEDLA